MKNMRVRRRPKTTHPDFRFVRGSSSLESDKHDPNTKSSRKILSNLREGNFDFGVCCWGKIGKVIDIGHDSTSYYLIEDLTENKTVRKVFEKIDWRQYVVYNIGAPQITPDQMIEAYEDYKDLIDE